MENPSAPGKLRHVTNYRVLNQALKRPDWPFMSSDSVRRQLDPETQVFCALDLCSSYHQVELAEEHRDMTTFTLPWGPFRYEILPMGLNPSSDKFNIESDTCTRSLNGCLKSVDDGLQQARNYSLLKDRLVILFDRFRNKNVKVKSSKFRISDRVKFGGFIAGVSGSGVYVEPDPDQIKSL